MTKRISKYSDPDKLARTLIYFPIIHTQADMGALSESVRRVALKKLGEKGWRRKINMIEKIWTKIDHVIDSFSLPYETVRLYQDGLPVCGREAEIVKELAKAGSRNHQLLLRLMEKGATIMGTESLELLMEEYELVKQTLAGGERTQKARIEAQQKALSNSLLKRRDQFIAHRINSTLLNGETGILFLGMLHSLEDLLSKDIRVIYPINHYL
jgi:hypothetical protein